VGPRDAQREDPDVSYLTNRSELMMRDLTFDLVTDDPGFALRPLAEKLVVAFTRAVPYLLVLLLTLPVALRREGGFVRRLLVITAPAALLGLLSGVFGLPTGGYIYGWLAGLWLICMATVALGIARLAEADHDHRRELLAEGLTPRRLLLGAAVAAVLLAGLLVGDGIHRRAIDWSNENGGVSAIATDQ
jgi:hypothetical protein